jgi:hypothetical protein
MPNSGHSLRALIGPITGFEVLGRVFARLEWDLSIGRNFSIGWNFPS